METIDEIKSVMTGKIDPFNFVGQYPVYHLKTTNAISYIMGFPDKSFVIRDKCMFGVRFDKIDITYGMMGDTVDFILDGVRVANATITETDLV